MIRFLFFIFLLTSALPALAQKQDWQDDPDFHPVIKKRWERRLAVMKPYDSNADQILQAKEIQAMIRKKFDSSDANRDGVLSAEEQNTILDEFAELREDSYSETLLEKRSRNLDYRLSLIDADENGIISYAEYKNYFSGFYYNMDRDEDGNLTLNEFRTNDEGIRRRPLDSPYND